MLYGFPLIPICSNFSRRIMWSTVFYALDKSVARIAVCLLFALFFLSVFSTPIVAVCVLCPSREPWWFLGIILFLSRCLFILTLIASSTIFSIGFKLFIGRKESSCSWGFPFFLIGSILVCFSTAGKMPVVKLGSLAGSSNMNSNCPYINCFVYK